MTSDSQFFIDGKPYKLEHSPEKVSRLLQLAGTSAEKAILVSEDGVEHRDPDELMEVRPGEHLTTREVNGSEKPAGKTVRYTVNGEENVTDVNPLSVEAILRRAGAGAAIDVDDVGSYYLENTADGRKYENPDDPVTISDGDKFLAIHVGSTPVA